LARYLLGKPQYLFLLRGLNMKLQTLLTVAALGLFATPAYAAITVTTGNTPGGANVLFNATCSPASINGPAALIRGCIGSAANDGVDFTSNEVIRNQGIGQANIESNDTDGFNELTISMTDTTRYFDQLVFDIDRFGSGGASGIQITIDALVAPALVWVLQAPVTSDGSGFFTVSITGGGALLRSVKITSDTALDSISQIRINPASLTTVSEPGVLALFGLGLAALATVRRKRV
jgi:hypothetical protein